MRNGKQPGHGLVRGRSGAHRIYIATLADLGQYSVALGSAQLLISPPNSVYASFGNGLLNLAGHAAQSTEVDLNGNIVYNLQADAYSYRTYRMQDLYTPTLPVALQSHNVGLRRRKVVPRIPQCGILVFWRKLEIARALQWRLPKPFAPLMAIAGKRVFNHRQGMRRGLDLIHFDSLALKLFVVEEETAQHAEAVLRHLAGLV